MQNILGKVRELSQVGAILPGYEAERDAVGSHYERRLGRIWYFSPWQDTFFEWGEI
jgi:hypothetical protein